MTQGIRNKEVPTTSTDPSLLPSLPEALPPCPSGDHWLQHPSALLSLRVMEWKGGHQGNASSGLVRINPISGNSDTHYHLSSETLNTKSFSPQHKKPKSRNFGSLTGSKAKFLNNTQTPKKKKVVGNLGCFFLIFSLRLHPFFFEYAKNNNLVTHDFQDVSSEISPVPTCHHFSFNH